MARPLRLEFEHALYHVTSRGDRREDIFWVDADRLAWLDLLGQVCERFNWQVFAYCLMSNHYHLLVQTPDGNLSAGMRQLNGVYTQRSNRAHGRSGHVFQGRFKAILVDADSYLLELARYVVLNPVRAGMVADAAAWPWSSYGATAGGSAQAPAGATAAAPGMPHPRWLNVDAIRRLFGSGHSLQDKQAAQARYASYVRAGVGLPSVWEQLNAQVFLGDDAFVQKMLDKLSQTQAAALTTPAATSARWQEVPVLQRKGHAKPIAAFEADYPGQRNAAIAAAFQSGRYTLQALAQHFGLHYTSVSRIVNAADGLG